MKKHRILSLFLVLALIVSALPASPISVNAVNTSLPLNVTTPFTQDTPININGSTAYSNSYRIPAMVTLKDGTIVAAADIRWNTTYDGGGLDTLAAYSTDGGVTWNYSLANYLGDNGNSYNGSGSTSFIDPSLVVAGDGQTVYMLVDLYPYGIALNGSGHTAPSTDTGFNANGYLKLNYNGSTSYSYYLKEGKIYTGTDSEVSGYTVDGKFNLYMNGEYVSNLFFSDSPYKVARTGFLYLTSSSDGGKSWSDPKLLPMKTSSEMVCLVGPGRGITTADGTMIFPIYRYNGSNNSQRTGFLYSKDGENWNRVDSSVIWSSESSVVEIGQGILRFFYRNGSTRVSYVDYDMARGTWSAAVETPLVNNSNTQISAITYSKTSDGKQVILVSCPAGPGSQGSTSSSGTERVNGRIFVGLVNDDGSMTWAKTINVSPTQANSALTGSNYLESSGFFAYSCLTERSDGSIAILYENSQYGWGAGSNTYYTMNMKAYAGTELGLTFDEGSQGGSAEVPEGSSTISAGGLTLFSHSAAFTGLEVTPVEGPTASYIEKSNGYNVTVTDKNGAYTGFANITLAVPDGWDGAKMFGYVKEANGTITPLAGTAESGVFSFNTPHFSEIGIMQVSDLSDLSGFEVALKVGDSQTVTIEGENYSKGWECTVMNPNIADVVVAGSDGTPASTRIEYHSVSATCNDLISANSTSWVAAGNGTTKYYYTPDNGAKYYPVYAMRTRNSGRYTYTWGYSVTDNASNVTPISGGTQTTNKTSDAANISVYTSSEVNIPATPAFTTIVFTGKLPGQTTATVGGQTINILVEGRDVEKGFSLFRGGSKTLDALADVGLTGAQYTVSYAIGSDPNDVLSLTDGNVTASAGATGNATVIATIKKDGTIIATVTYNISVYDVQITDSKPLYVPVGGSAVVSGLNGTDELNKTMTDTSIADATKDSTSLTVTGVSLGETAVVVGTVEFVIHVVPQGDSQFASASKKLYISVAGLNHTTGYYAINGGVLHKIEGTGILVDQDYVGGFNIMLFGKPDEGYALTSISMANTVGQYYTLSNGTRADGSDSDAWPFVDPDASTVPSDGNNSAWKAGHGFRYALIENNMTIEAMRDLFARALALGCNGVCTVTRNHPDDFTNGVFTLTSEKMATLTKTIVSYKRDSTTYPYTPGTVLKFGDVITYRFTITTESTHINYTKIILSDSTIGYTELIPNNTIDTADDYFYTAEYTITADDIDKYVGGVFHNTATLFYDYSSAFSEGVHTSSQSSSVDCTISGMVIYQWDDSLPEEVKENLLPATETHNFGDKVIISNATYQPCVVTQGSTRTTWYFTGWYCKNHETIHPANYETTMPESESIILIGKWEKMTENITTSLTITKTGAAAIDTNQTFLFRITGNGLDMMVSIHGNESVTICGLTVGVQYTVTEITDWSWRYSPSVATTLVNTPVDNGATVTLTDDAAANTMTFNNSRNNPYWLDGDSFAVNIFGSVTD